MPFPTLPLVWAGLWAVTRLLAGLLPTSLSASYNLTLELDWWRITVRADCSGDGAGLVSGLTARRRHALRRWFAVGAAAGLLAGATSVALLLTELWTLLQTWNPAPGQSAEAAAASVAATAPRLQLALPGVSLPASHALPLWLALAVSLAIHEAGHALAAAANGVAVNGAGVCLMLLMPAAFVELDDADLAALSRHSVLQVATAGAWHNAALGLACWTAAAAAAQAAAWLPALAWVLGPLSTPLQLLLAYAVSLSAALALLNMAPVHFLDGQQALEALLLRPAKPNVLPKQEGGASSGAEGPSGSGSSAARRAVVRWVLHAGSALYGAVLALHLLRAVR